MMDADIAQRDIVVGNGDCVPLVDVDVEVLDDLAIVGGVNRRGGVSEADRLRRRRRLGLRRRRYVVRACIPRLGLRRRLGRLRLRHLVRGCAMCVCTDHWISSAKSPLTN